MLQRTRIKAPKEQIFSNVVISGTWDNEIIYGDWFDFDISGKKDNIHNFENLMALCSGGNMTQLYLAKGVYCVSQVNNSAPIVVPSNVYWHNSATIQLLPSNYTHYAIVSIKQAKNVVIDGGVFVGDLKTHLGTKGEWGHGIKVEGSSNVTIKNLQTRECWGDGIDLVEGEYVDSLKVGVGNCYRVTIDNVKSLYNRRQGLSIEAAKNVVVKNSEFAYTGKFKMTEPGCGVDIEPWCKNEEKIDNISFANCFVHDNNPERDFCIESNLVYWGIESNPEYTPANDIRVKNSKIGKLHIQGANTVAITNCDIDDIMRCTFSHNIDVSESVIRGTSGVRKAEGLKINKRKK